MRLDAPAKINLTLEVLGRRADGYHELRMVMQTVSLCDTVTVELGEPDGEIRLQVRGGDPAIPTDARNLAWRAATRFFEATGLPRRAVFIDLEKRIPSAAGLAGGSADAAAVLRGLNALTGADLAPEALAALALPLGADLPYCVLGGTKLAQGIGERLTAMPSMPDCAILLCKPDFPSLTGQVYAAYDAAPVLRHAQTAALTEALARGALSDLAELCGNDLEPAVSAAHPEIAQIEETMLSHGALGAAMSGSGPTVYGIFPSAAAAQPAQAALAGRYEQVFLTEPVERMEN